jgi:tight adherence protein B
VNAQVIAAVVAVVGGIALLAAGLMKRTEEREDWLAEVLDLPFGEQDVDVARVIEDHGPVVEGTVGLASKMVDQFDSQGTLRIKLERARLPMKPGEFVVIAGCTGVVFAAAITALTNHWWMGLLAIALAPFGGNAFLDFRINKRRKAFEAQLPEALSLIAASLSAGHTFLRAIQMMCEEADEPLATEFARVVFETQLGDPLVDALDRMAQRAGVEDAVWVVQAIRIQQSVGGTLAELLHTLADFMRAREEIRREVAVLTAEGRISGWVVGALPIVVFVAIQVVSPHYMEPMFRGWGPAWLALAGACVAAGIAFIQRLARIKV